MRKAGTIRIILTVILVLIISGCGGGGSNNVKTYGGADPKGDYVAVTIDSSAGTITYHNYTTAEHFGPYPYSQITDPARNFGFHHLFATGVIPDYPVANCYAEFVIMDGVALILQMFDNKGTATDYSDDETDGNPIFAYYRQAVNMNDYRERAFNWVSLKMGATEGNFEVGFAAFDTNTTSPAGLLYGGGYSQRAEIAGWTDYNACGMKNINDSGIATSSFSYDSSIIANTYSDLTMIAAASGDFIIDNGAGKGASFAFRQAAAKDWQSAYNGTYFMVVYQNDHSGAVQEVETMKVVFSGSGSFQAYDPIHAAVPSTTGTFTALETYPKGPCPPGFPMVPFATQIRDISGCHGTGVVSAVVRNAYQCHGGFVAGEDEGLPPDKVIFLMMEPGGRYLCFTVFEKDGASYHYAFGFGIKDSLF